LDSVVTVIIIIFEMLMSALLKVLANK